MFFCWWAAFSGTTDRFVKEHSRDTTSDRWASRSWNRFPASLGHDTTGTRESGTSFVAYDRDKESEGVSNNNKEKKGVFWKPDIKAIGRQLSGCF